MPSRKIVGDPKGYNNAVEVACRAKSKSVQHTIDTSGRDGEHGLSGEDGTPGVDGQSLTNPNASTHVSIASSGGRGSNGESGENGLDGSDIIIYVEGTSSEFKIFQDSPKLSSKTTTTTTTTPSATTTNGPLDHLACYTINLDECSEGIVFLNARGGDGGNGGIGGRGGNGGRGGDVKITPKKKKVKKKIIEGYYDEDLEDIGNVDKKLIDASRGGNGGQGGNGGNGGNAGNGGNIIVKSRDSSLFIFIESNYSSGEPGLGGAGGEGGEDGMSGCILDDMDMDISPQNKMITNSGIGGKDGRSGAFGKDGNIQYEIIDEVGNTLEVHKNGRYNAAVTSYIVIDEKDDGIYEPGELIFIKDITIVNNGGMTLPAGCKVQIARNPTIHILNENQCPVLGELKSGESVTLPDTFTIQIPDVHLSDSSSSTHSSSCTFHPKVSLLGRVFEESEVETTLVVSQPVEITSMSCPEAIGPQDKASVTVRIKNNSHKLYGNTKESSISKSVASTSTSGESMGVLYLVFVFSDKFRPLVPYEKITNQSETQHHVKYPICELSPDDTAELTVPFCYSKDVQLYDVCQFSVQLFVRNKLVQVESKQVACHPLFVPGIVTDCLLVLPGDTTKEEMRNWAHIFKYLNLSVNFWDLEYNNGFEISKDYGMSWVGTCHTVIFPVYYEEEYQFLYSSQRLMDHMKQNETHTENGSQNNDRYGIIIFSSYPVPSLDLYFKHFGKVNDVSSEFVGNHVVAYPALSDIKAVVRKIREKHIPQDTYSWMETQVSFERTSILSPKYSYGSLTYTTCPLLRDARVYNLISESILSFIEQGERPRNEGSVIFSSEDTLVLLGLCRALPIEKKLSWIMNEESSKLRGILQTTKKKSERTTSVDQNGEYILAEGGNNTSLEISIPEIGAYMLSLDFAQDLLSCVGVRAESTADNALNKERGTFFSIFETLLGMHGFDSLSVSQCRHVIISSLEFFYESSLIRVPMETKSTALNKKLDLMKTSYKRIMNRFMSKSGNNIVNNFSEEREHIEKLKKKFILLRSMDIPQIRMPLL